MNTLLYPIIMLCCALQACSAVQQTDTAVASPASDLDQARALIGPRWPLKSDTRLTTAGDIYLDNLDSQIAALQKVMARRADDRLLARLALAYYHRFQVLGSLPDAEQARGLLHAASGRNHDSAVDLSYAQVLLGFHEFELAHAALDSATLNGAGPGAVNELRRAIARATGGEPDPRDAAAIAVLNDDSPAQLVTRAAAQLERGHAAEASRLLLSAQDRYTDSAPYLLAWIHVQQGIVFLRHLDYVNAAQFFAAAHERFPEYALGNHRVAAELYTQVADQTGNPEFYYRLAKAERALGRDQNASRHARMAQSGYADLLNRYPTMFADHAARYFMATGDTAAALALAQQNMHQRQDIRARMLLLLAELTAGNRPAACARLKEIRVLDFDPPELPALASVLGPQCSPLVL